MSTWGRCGRVEKSFKDKGQKSEPSLEALAPHIPQHWVERLNFIPLALISFLGLCFFISVMGIIMSVPFIVILVSQKQTKPPCRGGAGGHGERVSRLPRKTNGQEELLNFLVQQSRHKVCGEDVPWKKSSLCNTESREQDLWHLSCLETDTGSFLGPKVQPKPMYSALASLAQ